MFRLWPILFLCMFNDLVFASGICRHTFVQDDEYTLAQARSKYKSAVVNIASKSDEIKYLGTGFLLDEELGLYLTAQHVIRNIDDKVTLIAIHGEFPVYQEYSLEVIQRGSNHDLALLQLKNKSDRPLSFESLGNLNFKEAKEGDDALFVFGRGNVDDERELRSAPAAFTNWTKRKSLMQVNTTIVFGDSGGPLLDKYGRVTGVSKAKSGSGIATTGEYTPSIFVGEVLKQITPNVTVVELSTKLKNDDNFTEHLFAKHLNQLSNLELLMLADLIESNPASYSTSNNLLLCPFYTALTDRGMEHIAYKISFNFPKETKARALIASITGNSAILNPNSKLEVLHEAITLLSDAQKVAENKGFSNEYKGYLSLEIANAQYSKSLVTAESSQRSALLFDSVRNFVKAGQLTPKLEELSLAMSGNAFWHLGEAKLAARAYKTSKELALRNNSEAKVWVSKGYLDSLNKAKCNEDCSFSLDLITTAEIVTEIENIL